MRLRRVSATVVAVSLFASALSIPQTAAEDNPGIVDPVAAPASTTSEVSQAQPAAPAESTEKSPRPFSASDTLSSSAEPTSTTPPTDTNSTPSTTEPSSQSSIPTSADRDSARYAPSYADTSPVIMGRSESTENLLDEVPAGTSFSLAGDSSVGWSTSIDSSSGAVTAKLVLAGEIPGTLSQRVLVSYPDGSSERITATFHADRARTHDSDEFQPSYSESTVAGGQSVTVTPQWNGTTGPNGVTFTLGALPVGWEASVETDTGVLKVSADASKKPGNSARFKVTVHYADGSHDDVTAAVRVPTEKEQDPDAQAASLNPTMRDIVMSTDRVSTAFVAGGPFPQGTVFSVFNEGDSPVSPVIDAHSGRLTLIPNVSAHPAKEAVIHVTASYPDRSVDVVPAHIRVVDDSRTMAGRVETAYLRSVVPFGGSTSVRPHAQFPEGTTFSLEGDAPQGWNVRVDGLTGEIHVKVDRSIREVVAELPIRMDFDDGSQGISLASVAVVNLAENMKVSYPRSDIAYGTSAQVLVDGAPVGSSYSIVEAPGDGWEAAIADDGTLEVATPKDSTREESKILTIRIIFPDRSAAIVEAEFHASAQAQLAHEHLESKGPEAGSLNQVVDQLGLEDYIDPSSGKLTKPMTSDVVERVQAVYGASGNGESLNTDSRGDVVVDMDSMLNMASTGLPFVEKKIRAGEIRVAGA